MIFIPGSSLSACRACVRMCDRDRKRHPPRLLLPGRMPVKASAVPPRLFSSKTTSSRDIGREPPCVRGWYPLRRWIPLRFQPVAQRLCWAEPRACSPSSFGNDCSIGRNSSFVKGADVPWGNFAAGGVQRRRWSIILETLVPRNWKRMTRMTRQMEAAYIMVYSRRFRP